ncbi:unnamed protein product [Phytomonas sp. Hart1]|nr:unnamed protein product [Phytomonas sp. Hart1]|eukprot:CCW71382.1 unnamed protein product [Phytomonas sp. isolate Hart1]
MPSPFMEANVASIPYVDHWMLEALNEAQFALDEHEVPVGAVLVPLPAHQLHGEDVRRAESQGDGPDSRSPAGPALDTRMWVSRGRNATNRRHHALAHAEFLCVEGLLRGLGAAEGGGEGGPADLSNYVLYVTVEPCVMCAALLRDNRIAAVFFGCPNLRFGGNGSVLALHNPNPDPPKGGEGTAEPIGASPPRGYRSEGGHRAQEAIGLLQKFYLRENPNAPGVKRKRKLSTLAR